MDNAVVALTVVLVVVLIIGQLSVGMFTEGLDDTTTLAPKIEMAGINQASALSLFDALQTRSNNVKKRIDTINQLIPRTIDDITVSTVSYVPWEQKERSAIQITKVPYPYQSKNSADTDCSCNYGCKWNISFVLPIGPTGNPGQPGPIGPPGQSGVPGAAGQPGPRGNWAA